MLDSFIIIAFLGALSQILRFESFSENIQNTPHFLEGTSVSIYSGVIEMKVYIHDFKSVAIVWENTEVRSVPFIDQYHSSMSLHSIPVSSTPEISSLS
jgi:hypothetical protein